MFIKRDIAEIILAGAQQMPVVAIIGPRQSGKSTLAKQLFPNHTYLDMQDAELLDFANHDPKGFLKHYRAQNTQGLIIDEAQYAPALFSQIKVLADQDPKAGYYILSGSQNFLLHEKISESLAGRVYFYKLLPLSIHELKAANLLGQLPGQIFNGFYPRVYQSNLNLNPKNINFTEYYTNYISTYVERDIRSIRNIEHILVFKKFMQLCALRIGATLNISDLATNCGISQDTARNWLSLLETSFILFLLPSYHNNLGKRVVKSPKLYFYDVGLAAVIMGADSKTLIEKRDIYGALFENLVIVDLIKNFAAHNISANLTFFRDSNQKEIDLIIEVNGKIIPIEIKASETAQAGFFDTINWFKEITNNLTQATVIYGGASNQIRTSGQFLSWQNLDQLVK
jgi:hypothetical protein